ncbi:MAG: sigma 54-interacting transcriptional regulator [Pseudomonadota bacterium]
MTSRYRYILEAADDPTDRLRFYLEPGQHTVGRSGADITIPLEGISREHCALEVLKDGGMIVRDLGSTNGTWVDGQRMTACALTQATQLAFGEHIFRLLPDADEGLTLLARSGARIEPHSDMPAPPTLRADREAALWATALASVIKACDSFPAAPWIAGLREALGAAALELRRTDTAAIVASAGRSKKPLERLAESDAWQLYGVVDDPPSDALLRMLSMVPSPKTAAPGIHSNGIELKTGTLQPELHQQLLDASRIAQSNLSILIRGPSGTGKEWTAHWLHDHSPRADQSFYALNCAAIPDELLEAELFGIESGVATGVEARAGVFTQANKGTLFLDEIGEMPPTLQAKLLRALDSGEVIPVGSRRPGRVDVRVFSATNRNLEEARRTGTFRDDLYFRLAAHVLNLPPLAQRAEDIPALLIQFFQDACTRSERLSPGVTTRAMAALIQHRWPGNIRELKSTIDRAVQLLNDGQPLDLPQLPDELKTGRDADFSMKTWVGNAEAQALRTALQASDGNISDACRLLRIGRSTFYDKARALGLDFKD